MEKTKSQHIKLNARDFNSQLVLHGTNGDSRILEAPIKYVKELQKGPTKFNNSYEAMILNKIEPGYATNTQNLDIYNLNQMFGLPHEIMPASRHRMYLD